MEARGERRLHDSRAMCPSGLPPRLSPSVSLSLCGFPHPSHVPPAYPPHLLTPYPSPPGPQNYFLLICILSYWFPWCRYVVLALLSTLALPAKPVLWPAFNRLWLFKTWRHYFHYSFLIEEPLDPKKRYIFVE